MSADETKTVLKDSLEWILAISSHMTLSSTSVGFSRKLLAMEESSDAEDD